MSMLSAAMLPAVEAIVCNRTQPGGSNSLHKSLLTDLAAHRMSCRFGGLLTRRDARDARVVGDNGELWRDP